MTIKPVGTLNVAWFGHEGATEPGAGALNALIAAAGTGVSAELEHKTTLSDGADLTLKVRGLWQHGLTDAGSSQNLALSGNPTAPLT